MNNKKTAILILLFILTAIFFQVAFLYDTRGNQLEITHETHVQSLWLFFAVMALSFVPCFMMGYSQMKPTLGFIPPAFLVGLFWILLTHRFSRADINIMTLEKYMPHMAVAMTVIAGFFGILVVSLSSRIFDSWSKKEQEEDDDNQQLIDTNDAINATTPDDTGDTTQGDSREPEQKPDQKQEKPAEEKNPKEDQNIGKEDISGTPESAEAPESRRNES